MTKPTPQTRDELKTCGRSDCTEIHRDPFPLLPAGCGHLGALVVSVDPNDGVLYLTCATCMAIRVSRQHMPIEEVSAGALAFAAIQVAVTRPSPTVDELPQPATRAAYELHVDVLRALATVEDLETRQAAGVAIITGIACALATALDMDPDKLAARMFVELPNGMRKLYEQAEARKRR